MRKNKQTNKQYYPQYSHRPHAVTVACGGAKKKKLDQVFLHDVQMSIAVYVSNLNKEMKPWAEAQQEKLQGSKLWRDGAAPPRLCRELLDP